jgi:hypothetical protein
MPCRDYEDDWGRSHDDGKIDSLQKQNDRLARIACKVMQADRQAAINEIKRLEEAVDGTRLAKKGLERDIKKQEKALQKAKDELAKRK